MLLDDSCEGTSNPLDLSNTRPQHLQLDPIDGFVAAEVLLRQEPDDEDDEEDEDEDGNHDEDEDDDDQNDDGYSERPSADLAKCFLGELPWVIT